MQFEFLRELQFATTCAQLWKNRMCLGIIFERRDKRDLFKPFATFCCYRINPYILLTFSLRWTGIYNFNSECSVSVKASPSGKNEFPQTVTQPSIFHFVDDGHVNDLLSQRQLPAVYQQWEKSERSKASTGAMLRRAKRHIASYSTIFLETTRRLQSLRLDKFVCCFLFPREQWHFRLEANRGIELSVCTATLLTKRYPVAELVTFEWTRLENARLITRIILLRAIKQTSWRKLSVVVGNWRGVLAGSSASLVSVIG